MTESRLAILLLTFTLLSCNDQVSRDEGLSYDEAFSRLRLMGEAGSQEDIAKRLANRYLSVEWTGRSEDGYWAFDSKLELFCLGSPAHGSRCITHIERVGKEFQLVPTNNREFIFETTLRFGSGWLELTATGALRGEHRTGGFIDGTVRGNAVSDTVMAVIAIFVSAGDETSCAVEYENEGYREATCIFIPGEPDWI